MIDSYNMYWFVLFNVLPYGVFHGGCVVAFKLCYIQVISECFCDSSPFLVPQSIVFDDIVVALFEFGLVEPSFILLI